MANTTLLVTGATGYMASRYLPVLRDRYRLRLVDVRVVDGEGERGTGEVEIADLTGKDRSAFAHLFDGVDVVVHLGYRRSAPGGVYDDTTPHIDKFDDEFANLRMAQNVYRCAYDAGVRRVVMASSNHAADWYEHAQIHAGTRDSVDPYELPLSDNFYGWSKAAYEHLGFLYASGVFGRRLEVVQIRIGAPRDIDASTYSSEEPEPPSPGPQHPTGLARYKRDLGAWQSERDGQQLLRRAIDTEDIRNPDGIPWLIVYGISGNTRAFWSLASARTVLGYRPEDDSEVTYADDIRRLLTGPEARVPGGRVGV
jgi:NAD+ dependent glucose-6-phosphate dehydrogenase